MYRIFEGSVGRMTSSVTNSLKNVSEFAVDKNYLRTPEVCAVGRKS